MAKKILVAIDVEHKENAQKALREAHQLAICIGAEIHVCYVLAYGFYDYIKPYLVEEVLKDSIAHVKEEMADIVSDARLGEIEIHKHVLKGGVYQQILLLAEQMKPSYIILNSSRPDGVSGMTGPVTAQIARCAPCNLLIVR